MPPLQRSSRRQLHRPEDSRRTPRNDRIENWHEGLKFCQTSIIFIKREVLFYARVFSFDADY